MGICSDFKKRLLTELPSLHFCQTALLQTLSSLPPSRAAPLLRLLLSSAFLLHRGGLRGRIPIADVIDLALSSFSHTPFTNRFIEEVATNRVVDAIPSALQVMQSVLTVLTRGGELLLNIDLFPHFETFLHDRDVMEIVRNAPISVKTWYFVCLRYLSFDSRPTAQYADDIDSTLLLSTLETLTSAEIPIGCNCVRAVFPRDWNIGFGPYPASCFPVINKHNGNRNIISISLCLSLPLISHPHFHQDVSAVAAAQHLRTLLDLSEATKRNDCWLWQLLLSRSTDRSCSRVTEWTRSANTEKEISICSAPSVQRIEA